MISIPFKNKHYKGFIAKDFNENEFTHLLETPDALFKNNKALVFKDDHTSTVAKVPITFSGDKRYIVVKRWNKPNLDRMLVSAPRPKRVWEAFHTLPDLGIATAKPVAMLYHKYFSFFYPSYVITENISGALPLHDFLRSQCQEPQDKKDVLLTLASLLASIHDSGVYHDDLKTNNFLLTNSQGTKRIFIIDFDGIRFFSSLPEDLRFKSLARALVGLLDLNYLSSADLRYLLSEYLKNIKHPTSLKIIQNQVFEMISAHWPAHKSTMEKIISESKG